MRERPRERERIRITYTVPVPSRTLKEGKSIVERAARRTRAEVEDRVTTCKGSEGRRGVRVQCIAVTPVTQ